MVVYRSTRLFAIENKTMDFYVSWYPGDPDYMSFDSTCALLISITSVARDWTIRSLSRLPQKLLIDSGGYRYATTASGSPSAQEVLMRQLGMLDGAPVPVIVCARDYPILDSSISEAEKDKSITQTIASAYELKCLSDKGQLPAHVLPMGVIQGHSPHSLKYCAQELKAIDFPFYGVGSLAELRRHEPIVERIRAVIEVIEPHKLHVFGVSSINTIRTLARLGVRSFDSAQPAKAAMYNEVIYSKPYRRYGILEPGEGPMRGRIPRHRRLNTPLACDCPVCQRSATSILIVGKRQGIRDRALHNYYHLKREFTSL